MSSSFGLNREKAARAESSGSDMSLDDSDLLKRIIRGDRVAFETVFHRYQPQLKRFVGRLTSRHDLAEEIANDTWVVVWQRADRFRGESKLSSWILGIAYRTALKRLARLARSREDELTETVQPVDHDEPEAALVRAAAQAEKQELVQGALKCLSPEHRAVVELAFFHGLSYKQIAQNVGCPENTVKTRMFHARKRLKRLLRAEGRLR